jgi:glucokinase
MYFLGIDIGGTKTAISLSDAECDIIDTNFVKTFRTPDFSGTRDNIFHSIDELLEKYGITAKNTAIGISCPGPLDIKNGRIAFVATTGWRDIPVVQMFREKYEAPVFLDNDCACAALAEAHKGAGQGVKVVFYATVSTGIGSGICIDSKIFGGENGNAGEFGHICVDPQGPYCPCGAKGCLQLYSSGSAIAETVEKRAREKPSCLSGKGGNTAYDVEMAVRENDPLAVEVWDEAMEKLGMGVGIIYQLLNPGAVIFGGGVSNAWDLMEERLYASIKNYVYEVDYGSIVSRHVLRRSKLGKVIGTTGAILLAQRSIK